MSAKSADPQAAIVSLDGREVQFRISAGRATGRRRLRVGLGGVEVVEPGGADIKGARDFIQSHGDWVLAQLDRIERIRAVRKVQEMSPGEILFRGVATPVFVDALPRWNGGNRVLHDGDRLIVGCGRAATNSPAKTLENWLRRQARAAIGPLVDAYSRRIRVAPGRLYIMDQRTKWGNCSTLGNLSFNWRIVMATEPVLRYLVAHEVVHLAVPDHSQRFWLSLQSVCPESERARQWLVANSHRLTIDLERLIRPGSNGAVPHATGRPASDDPIR